MPPVPTLLEDPSDTLLNHLPSYHNNSSLSDGTIRCGQKEFPTHKVILCAQSKFFLNAFTGEWKESSESVLLLNDDEVSTVEAMLRFFYTFDYDASGATNGNTSPMVFNVKVYSIADKYDIPALRAQAKEKFRKAVETCWDMDDFLYAIAEVYSSTPPNDKCLRNAVVAVACEHMQELLCKQGFSDVLEETVGFASDISRRQASNLQQSKNTPKEYRCSSCRQQWETSTATVSVKYCLLCGEQRSDWSSFVVR